MTSRSVARLYKRNLRRRRVNADRSPQIAIDVKNVYDIESLAHLTCIGSTRDEVVGVVDLLLESGVHNILALEDPPQEAVSLCCEETLVMLSIWLNFYEEVRREDSDWRGRLSGRAHRVR